MDEFLLRDISLQMGELAAQAEEALEVAREENGPFVYEPMLMNDVSRLKKIREAAASGSYEAFYHAVSELTFDRLAAARSKEIDPEKKAYVSDLRIRVKKAAEKCRGYLWKPVTGSSNRGDQKYQNCDPGSFRYGKAF